MAYELHLKADTIAELTKAVEKHFEELTSVRAEIIVGDTVVRKGIAERSTFEQGWNAPSDAAQFPPVPNVQTDPDTSAVDAEGLPWDERIHSSNRRITAKGVWTRRKNVDDAVYNSVVAELRGEPQAPITGAFAAELPQPVAPVHSAPVEQPVAPASIPPFLQSVMQPAPLAPAAPQTINDLFIKLQQLSKEGIFTAQYNADLIGALVQQFQVQVNSINDIAARPDMIAAAFQYIAARGN